MEYISEELARNVVGAFKEKGRRWLKKFPYILQGCKKKWSLGTIVPLEDLSYNFVGYSSMNNGTKIIIKIGVPCREFLYEIEMLKLYNGDGAVKLIDHDLELGVLIQEQLEPGISIKILEDETSIPIASSIMKKLWKPVPNNHALPYLSEWTIKGLRGLRYYFKGGTGPFPVELVVEAEYLFEKLLYTTKNSMILHGDLHQYNILSSGEDTWVAIDPKGVIGDPAFEPAAFLRNNLSSVSNVKEALTKRLQLFSRYLELDHKRILEWSIAQTVLSSWWLYEAKNPKWEEILKRAMVLSNIYKEKC